VEVPEPILTLKPGATVASPVFAAQLREFALAVLEGRPPSVPAEYGRYIVQVLDACTESSRSGREVLLPN
jgi:predicted dehydrogenase